jgi:two-component system phosphate regulon sensor histidine kinase PhoR
MKKTFPIIFTLIALSILGILFIQVTWLQGLFLLQKNQLADKLNQSGVLVANDISKKMNSGLSFRFPKRGLGLNQDYHLHKFNETTISDVFDYKDINNKIRTALDKYGVKDVDYEFAIADKKGNIEIKTKHFEDALRTR